MSECAGVQELLSAWLDAELSHEDAAAVRFHVTGCQACEEEIQALRRTRSALRSLPPRSAPVDLLAARRRPRSRTAVAAMTLLVGALGASVVLLGSSTPADGPVVEVPVELFVADHLLHSASSPVGQPLLVEAGR